MVPRGARRGSVNVAVCPVRLSIWVLPASNSKRNRPSPSFGTGRASITLIAATPDALTPPRGIPLTILTSARVPDIRSVTLKASACVCGHSGSVYSFAPAVVTETSWVNLKVPVSGDSNSIRV